MRIEESDKLKIKAMLARRGMTQLQLAAASRIDPVNLSAVLNGRKGCSSHLLAKIVQHAGGRLHIIITGPGETITINPPPPREGL